MEPSVVVGVPLLVTVTVELVRAFAPVLLIPPMRTEPGGPLVLTRLALLIVSAADATAGTAAINAVTVVSPHRSRPIHRK